MQPSCTQEHLISITTDSVTKSPSPTYRSASLSSTTAIGGSAAFLLLFHLLANAFTPYGYFRDELYYLACSHRLALGYVDHPPLSVWLLALVRTLIGDSLFAIRLVPALALSGTVVMTGLMVRQMKGGNWAIILGGLSVILAPIFLAMGTFYSMNSLDILLWSAAAYAVLRVVDDPTPRRWVVLGLLMGVGLLNKVGFLWFGTGLLAGLLLTPLRAQLTTPWPYVAAGIAFLLFSPFVVWNVQNDFAHLEFMRNAVLNKYGGISRSDFLSGAVLMMNPVAVAVWVAGLYYYFASAEGRTYRVLGIIFLATFLILVVNGHSKSEYLAPAFPMLLAGGGVALERLAQRRRWRWVPATITVLLMPIIAVAPLVVPLLPPADYVNYAATVGVSTPNSEGKEMAELPQFFADMHGWEELAANVSRVYQALPEHERKQASIYAPNYGEAAALEHFRGQYPLPPVISGHNNYWLWGYGSTDPEVMIILGGEQEDHRESFEQVDAVAVHRAAYVMPYENNLPIFVSRGLRAPAAEIWPGSKHYD